MAEGSSRSKGKGVGSSSASETNTSWPFKINIEPDHLRTDVLKIDPSKEFEEHIVRTMSEANRAKLHAWYPIGITFKDVKSKTGARDTHKMQLAKREAYKFYVPQEEEAPVDLRKAKEKFFYALEPFGHVRDKKQLYIGKPEISLRWSSTQKDTLEFLVEHRGRLDLRSSRK